LYQELGEQMTVNVTVVRHNDKFLETNNNIDEMIELWNNINMIDSSRLSNHAIMFMRHMKNILHLARIITLDPYNLNEIRCANYKPEYPDRNDEEWLKTTLAEFNQTSASPEFSYEDVDVSLIEPRLRDYTQQH